MAGRTKDRAVSTARVIFITFVVLLVVAVIVGFTMLGRIIISPLIHGGGSGVEIAVPQVVGLSEENGMQVLRDTKLSPKLVSRVQSDEQQVGFIFKQNPAADEKVRPGRKVLLWVSLGRASFVVPDLSGEHISNVPQVLAKAGLQLGAVTRIYYEGTPAGRVLNQNPAPGQEFTSQIPVDVTVADSTNLPKLAMPDVSEEPLATAEDMLSRSNLHLARVVYVANDSLPSGNVIRQDIAAGTQVALGSRVELEVALPSAVLAAPTKSVTVHIPVPPGPPKQQIKIKVYDDLNPKGNSVCDEERAPGLTVEKQLELQGKASIQIFIGDMSKPYREERFGERG